jgi:hypothetical protein
MMWMVMDVLVGNEVTCMVLRGHRYICIYFIAPCSDYIVKLSMALISL